MATTLVSYPHGVRLSQTTSLQLPCTVNVTCPLDIQMSIRPLDKQKSPLDIQMSVRPLDEQKCPLDIQMSIRPMDEWTLSDVKHVSFLSPGVMLDRITSLQQFWHCKRKMSIGQTEMSIGHSYVHSSSGRTEMSIGHPNVHSSIGRMDEWTLSDSKHSSLLSTFGQTQSDYVITASLAS